MRAVIDTNVLLAGLLWRGPPYALLEQVRSGELVFISSPELLAELAEVLARPKFDEIVKRSQSSREQMLLQVRMLAEVIDPPPLPQPVCRDPDDDAVLALAIAAQADLIVSGDDDLLSLQRFEGIPILSPAIALQRVMNSV
jgi:uncharacterized protein